MVELPAPGHRAPRVAAGGRVVADVLGVRRVHRHGQDRVGRRVGAVAARKVVEAEVVLDTVGGGDPPVLHGVVVEVTASAWCTGQSLDLGAVVVLEVPTAGGVVTHDGAGAAAQDEGGVLATPALVGRVGDSGLVARLVGTLDVAGLVLPAVADPGGLGVSGRGLAVDRRRIVGEGDPGGRAAEGRRDLDRVAVGEVAAVGTGAPGRRRRERGRGVVAEGAVRRGRGGEHHRAARGHGRRGGYGGFGCCEGSLPGSTGLRGGRVGLARGQGDVGGDLPLAVGPRGNRGLGPAFRALGGRQRTAGQGEEDRPVGPPGGLQGLEIQGDASAAALGGGCWFGVGEGDQWCVHAGGLALGRFGHLDGDLVGALALAGGRGDLDREWAGLGSSSAAGGPGRTVCRGAGGLCPGVVSPDCDCRRTRDDRRRDLRLPVVGFGGRLAGRRLGVVALHRRGAGSQRYVRGSRDLDLGPGGGPRRSGRNCCPRQS